MIVLCTFSPRRMPLVLIGYNIFQKNIYLSSKYFSDTQCIKDESSSTEYISGCLLSETHL